MAEILIVTGLAREAVILRRALARAGTRAQPSVGAGPPILVRCGGPGPAGVARIFGSIADSSPFRFVLSIGLAGALVPGLDAGEACWPNEILDAQGHTHRPLALPEGIAARFGITVGGRLFSSPQPLADPRDKALAHADYGALLVDMESAGVAEFAARYGIPFAALRVVADEAGDRLPPAVLAATDEAGALHPARLAANLVRRPQEWRDFAQLARRGRRAERRLGRVGAALPEILLPLLG